VFSPCTVTCCRDLQAAAALRHGKGKICGGDTAFGREAVVTIDRHGANTFNCRQETFYVLYRRSLRLRKKLLANYNKTAQRWRAQSAMLQSPYTRKGALSSRDFPSIPAGPRHR